MDEDLHEGWKKSQSISVAGVAAVKEDNFVNYKLDLNREGFEVETLLSSEDNGQSKTTKKISKTEMIMETQS